MLLRRRASVGESAQNGLDRCGEKGYAVGLAWRMSPAWNARRRPLTVEFPQGGRRDFDGLLLNDDLQTTEPPQCPLREILGKDVDVAGPIYGVVPLIGCVVFSNFAWSFPPWPFGRFLWYLLIIKRGRHTRQTRRELRPFCRLGQEETKSGLLVREKHGPLRGPPRSVSDGRGWSQQFRRTLPPA